MNQLVNRYGILLNLLVNLLYTRTIGTIYYIILYLNHTFHVIYYSVIIKIYCVNCVNCKLCMSKKIILVT